MLEGVHFTTHSITSQKSLFSSLIVSLPTAAIDTPDPELLLQPKALGFLSPSLLTSLPQRVWGGSNDQCTESA